jgi:hypothetical protein
VAERTGRKTDPRHGFADASSHHDHTRHLLHHTLHILQTDLFLLLVNTYDSSCRAKREIAD